MKPKEYLNLISVNGFTPLPRFRWELVRNPRKTAREEAIAHEVIKQANPRENLSGSHPWGPEENWVLQQLWVSDSDAEWRNVPNDDSHLYETVETKFGELPVPNAVKPGVVPLDLQQKIREAID